jgi:hypothetical protein
MESYINQKNNAEQYKLSPLEKKLLCLMLIKQHNPNKKDLKMSIIQLIKFLGNCNIGDNVLGIFDLNKCCEYNSSANDKYSNNFYINNKKIAIHRLLYINFVDDLDDNIYLKHKCINKNCCNINHIEKANINTYNNKYEIYRIPTNNKNDKIIINLND